MATRAPRYYRPYYPSDSEESDASEESDISEESEDLPDFKAFANTLFRAAGPPLPTPEKELDFAYNTLDRRTTYGPLVESQGKYTAATTVQQTDNVVVLQSLDRDKGIYPQPTNCQLMLPRTYQNVTRFEIADINFIASFFYFRPEKYNVSVNLNETGRVLYDNVLSPRPSTVPLNLTVKIRQGTYTIDTLLQELTTQFNTPPVFYDFTNGYTDFYSAFIVAGDYGLNFNYPGDYFYDSLRQTYIAQPTIEQIVSLYFEQHFALTTSRSVHNSFTDLQIKTAYYYPVLKEFILDPQSTPSKISYNGAPLSESIITTLVYNFTGMDDPIVESLLKDVSNIALLDAYRLAHTFRYFPVNKYIFTYANQNTRVSIQTTTLNTSLTNLLTSQYSNYLTTQIQQSGLTEAQYLASSVQLSTYKSILSEMYDVLQYNFSRTFGVSYGTFADTYFLSFSNTMLLKNGTNATNVAYDYNIGNNPFLKSNLQDTFRQSNAVYWNSMISLSTSNVTLTGSNVIYDPRLLEQDNNNTFTDSNGNLYINPVEHTTDVIIRVSPGTYTILPIRSKVRQTVQVETIPRPSIYLYPEWNLANIDSIGENQYEFSGGYSYNLPVTPAALSNISNLLSPDLVHLGTVDPSDSIVSAFGKQTATTMTLGTTPSGTYFSFNTPDRLPQEDIDATIYKYKMGLAIFPSATSIPMFSNGMVVDAGSNTFTDDAVVFVYHDQAAFYADAGPVGRSNGESPFFYKYKITISSGEGAQYIPFTGYEAQTYYIICRPLRPLQFNPITIACVPFCTSSDPHILATNNTSFDPRLPGFNPYILLASNYIIAKVHDPDYIRLPIIDSNGFYYSTAIRSPLGLPGYLPSKSNAVLTADINTLLQKSVVPMGYYLGVSDDLTDYIPIPNTYPSRSYDPTNTYMFRYATEGNPYNPITQTYMVGVSNSILYENGSPYLVVNSNTVREKKIVQYTATHYIWTESNAFTSLSSNLQILDDVSFPGLRSPFVGRGACGFLFLPEEGTWYIKRFRFLSQSSNTNVHFLAIYPTTYINDKSYTLLSLEQAISICVLSESITYTTPSIAGSPYGTYYTYCNVLNPSSYVLSGTTQSTSNFITDLNAYYSAIAYTNPSVLSRSTFTLADFSNSSITTIENLTGTCIPYPSSTTPVISSRFYDGKPSPDQGHSMILSRPGSLSNVNANVDPLYANYYTSQYAQSSPIVNSHLHYFTSEFGIRDFISYTDFFATWPTLPDIPTNIGASVFGSILFQTGEFPIVYYTKGTTDTTLYAKTILTIDSIFPAVEDTVILTQGGNLTQYIFLGCTNTSNLVFKAYDTITGSILTYPSIASGIFDAQTQSVQGFQVKGTEWWLCYLDASSGMNILYGSNFTDPYFQMPTSFPGPYLSAKLQLDPVNGSNVYFAVSSAVDATFSNVYSFPIISKLPASSDIADFANYSLSPNTTSFAIQAYGGIEYIYLTRASLTYAYRMDPTTSVISKSQQNFNRVPTQCVAGPSNTLWYLFNTEPYLLGHVYSKPSVRIAWQLMFPVMKIEMVQTNERRMAIPDLRNLETPEWYHSVLFSYSNLQTLNGDLKYTNPSYTQWGQESYYNTADTSFQGYYFNAYLQNVPMQASNTSYIAVRGFSPTESFETELRVSLTNVYDYGYVTINELIHEIGTVNKIPEQYSASYRSHVSTFDSSFVISGTDALYGISTFSLPTTGFSNFITQFSTIYADYISLSSNANRINSYLNTAMNTFVSTHMQYILPSNALSRARFTDSITSSFLWKSGLSNVPPAYANLTDAWGLGWNLGFPKQDDAQPATVHAATSMYKIIDDFLYLRLNPEFNLNRMSAGTKENYLDSREPSGLTSYYYCKLILNGYGQSATTFVHSPILLNPPLPRIAKLSFQWLDSKGNLLNIDSATDSDWQMTLNIQENVSVTNFTEVPASSPQTKE